MITRKWLLLVIVASGVLLLCAFAVIPSVRLSYNDKFGVNVSYFGAQSDNDELTITVDYESDGEYFEIGRDIVVSTDSRLSNPLRLKSCHVDNGSYIYKFNAKDVKSGDKIYIKPPILYMPTEVVPIAVPLKSGSVAKMSAADSNIDSAGNDWLYVDSVNLKAVSQGVYEVRASVGTYTKDLPRFPKLNLGNQQVGGLSALYFDESDNFKSGEFVFYVNAGNEIEAAEQLSTASLVVSHALVRVDTAKFAITSNVKAITVVGNENT